MSVWRSRHLIWLTLINFINLIEYIYNKGQSQSFVLQASVQWMSLWRSRHLIWLTLINCIYLFEYRYIVKIKVKVMVTTHYSHTLFSCLSSKRLNFTFTPLRLCVTWVTQESTILASISHFQLLRTEATAFQRFFRSFNNPSYWFF
jgi:hypothetical protein